MSWTRAVFKAETLIQGLSSRLFTPRQDVGMTSSNRSYCYGASPSYCEQEPTWPLLVCADHSVTGTLVSKKAAKEHRSSATVDHLLVCVSYSVVFHDNGRVARVKNRYSRK